MTITKKILPISLTPELLTILRTFHQNGTCAYIVGGAVRDALLGITPKDIDIELYGSSYEHAVAVLQQYGRVDTVGKSFGVIKYTDSEKNQYDFSFPRTDSKVSNETHTKGRGFQVAIDTNLTQAQAASRRDFTINSLLYDPLTQTLHDYFNGEQDLQNKILRATSEAFQEDPLRVLRGMQFAARFNLTVDPETAVMALNLVDAPLVVERVAEEWLKLFSKGKYLSKGFQYLIDTGWIKRYPALQAIIGVPQQAEHHPEGSVEIHTMLAVDYAAKLMDDLWASEEDRIVITAATLMHDFGKVTTTQKDASGKLISYGHHLAGAAPARDFMLQIGMPLKYASKIIPLIEHHMDLIFYDEKSKNMNIRQIAEQLYPASVRLLGYVIQSDANGRLNKPFNSARLANFLDCAKAHNVYEDKAARIIQGKDILAVNSNIPTDAFFGKVLKDAQTAYLEQKINCKADALAWAMRQFRSAYAFVDGEILIQLGYTPGKHFARILERTWELQCANGIASKDAMIQYIIQNKESLHESCQAN